MYLGIGTAMNCMMAATPRCFRDPAKDHRLPQVAGSSSSTFFGVSHSSTKCARAPVVVELGESCLRLQPGFW